MALQLRYYPEDRDILTTTCTEVDKFVISKFDLIDEMTALMHDLKGAGLAAPQVGVLERIIVVRLEEGPSFHMINPVILNYSDNQRVYGDEGCLSIPGIEIRIRRPVSVTVEYQQIDRLKVKKHLSGWDARVVQHEIDHLNGKLILDHVASKLMRKQYEMKSRKWREKHAH